MALQLYKMRFREAHFGTGYLNTSSLTFSASQLYSALCLEALKNDCLDEWLIHDGAQNMTRELGGIGLTALQVLP